MCYTVESLYQNLLFDPCSVCIVSVFHGSRACGRRSRQRSRISICGLFLSSESENRLWRDTCWCSSLVPFQHHVPCTEIIALFSSRACAQRGFTSTERIDRECLCFIVFVGGWRRGCAPCCSVVPLGCVRSLEAHSTSVLVF